jgi:hypothetical protein
MLEIESPAPPSPEPKPNPTKIENPAEISRQSACYVYVRDTRARADIAKVLAFDEARRIAVNAVRVAGVFLERDMSEKTLRGPHSPAAKKTPKAAKRVAEPKTGPLAPMSEKTLRGPHSPAAKKTPKAAERVTKPRAVTSAPPPGGPYEDY